MLSEAGLIMFTKEKHYERAHKQSIEEQEKAGASFQRLRIGSQRRNRIWYLPPSSKNLFLASDQLLPAVMFGVAILVMLLSACLAETAQLLRKNVGAMHYSKHFRTVGFNVGFSVGPLLLSLELPC